MSAPRSPKAALAAARVLAGERKASVSRDTGVSRATIDRHLKAQGAMRKRVRRKAKSVDTGLSKAQNS